MNRRTFVIGLVGAVALPATARGRSPWRPAIHHPGFVALDPDHNVASGSGAIASGTATHVSGASSIAIDCHRCVVAGKRCVLVRCEGVTVTDDNVFMVDNVVIDDRRARQRIVTACSPGFDNYEAATKAIERWERWERRG